jgi:uncharacterized protein YkwD
MYHIVEIDRQYGFIRLIDLKMEQIMKKTISVSFLSIFIINMIACVETIPVSSNQDDTLLNPSSHLTQEEELDNSNTVEQENNDQASHNIVEPLQDCPQYAEGDDGCPISAACAEQEMLRLINIMRSEGFSCPGQALAVVNALAVEETLHRAARDHSVDMAANQYVGHIGQDGSTPVIRAQAAGYNSDYVGENIGAQHCNPAAALAAWQQSSGHCMNVMNTEYGETGIGYSEGADGTYWTQLFGRP